MGEVFFFSGTKGCDLSLLMDTTRTESGGPYRRKNVLLESYSDTSFAQAMENAARGKGISSRHAGVRVSGIPL